MVTVEGVMSKNAVTVAESASVLDAAKLMTKEDVSCLVVTRGEKPVAIVNENDLVKLAMPGKNLRKLKVKDVMSKGYETITPKTRFYKVEKLFNKDHVKRFFVVEKEALKGIITDTDIINATRDFTKLHQMMQEAMLVIFGLTTFFFLFYFSPLGQALFK